MVFSGLKSLNFKEKLRSKNGVFNHGIGTGFLDHFPLITRTLCRLQTFESKEEFPASIVSGERHTLTDAALKRLKPKDKVYKVADRYGLYVSVLSSGVISFRYNYAINGRQETLVLGRYGPEGITLKKAHEILAQAKKSVLEGRSPARLKTATKPSLAGVPRFGDWAEKWLENYQMAESTRDMRRTVFERDLRKPFGRLAMNEIAERELRALCDAIVARGAPATAVHAREVVLLVFRYAADLRHRYPNPALDVRP